MVEVDGAESWTDIAVLERSWRALSDLAAEPCVSNFRRQFRHASNRLAKSGEVVAGVRGRVYRRMRAQQS